MLKHSVAQQISTHMCNILNDNITKFMVSPNMFMRARKYAATATMALGSRPPKAMHILKAERFARTAPFCALSLLQVSARLQTFC